MRRTTSFIMDLEEILGGDFGEPLEMNIHCPKIANVHAKHKIKNWCLDQCELRVRMNHPCTITCDTGISIKKQLIKEGGSYLLTSCADMIRNVLKEETPLNSSKGKHKNKRDAIGGWGSKWLVDRNVLMVTEVLNGATVADISFKYELSPTRTSQIVRRFCKMANKKVYGGLPRINMEYLREKKNKFIPNFPKEYSDAS